MATAPRLALPNISRRTKRRGMYLSAAVGLATLVLAIAHNPKVTTHPLVVATATLPAGTRLSAADLTVTTMKDTTVTGALTTVAQALGKKLTYPLVAGQPLMHSDVTSGALIQGLSPGEVGIMLPVSLASSDNVRTGDRVSVIWLGSSSTGAATTPTASSSTGSSLAAGSTIATGLRVMAVLNSDGGAVTSYVTGGLNAATPASVELAVPSSLAGQLAIAADSGRFWLALTPWSTASGSVSADTPATPSTPITTTPTLSTGTNGKTGSVTRTSGSSGTTPQGGQTRQTAIPTSPPASHG